MKRARPPKGDLFYRQLWRIVDGAVMDCMAKHPDYFVAERAEAARLSLVKRATGALTGYVGQLPTGVDPSAGSAAKRRGGAATTLPANPRQSGNGAEEG